MDTKQTNVAGKVEGSKELDAKLVAAVKALPNVSARIRYLNDQKMSRGDIARFLSTTEGKEVRYQWVRNVLITPVKNPKAAK